jgi:hypothetical protein
MAREVPWFKLGGLAVLLAIVGGITLLVRGSQHLPDQVQPIAWHRQSCAHCQMQIGDPAHAAQLITGAGEVVSFDDPGCALRYLDEHRPAIHRLWFHHAHADRWLTVDEVAFTTGGVTPMGSGLLAVDRGTPGALDLEAARQHARTRAVPEAMAPRQEAHR